MHSPPVSYYFLLLSLSQLAAKTVTLWLYLNVRDHVQILDTTVVTANLSRFVGRGKFSWHHA